MSELIFARRSPARLKSAVAAAGLTLLASVMCSFTPLVAQPQHDNDEPNVSQPQPLSVANDGERKNNGQPPRRLYQGKVVLVREALQRRKITAFEELKDQVALETTTGQLIPILPDWRGRAFFQDKRLRNRRVDLVGCQHPGVPYLQVLAVYTFDEKDKRQYTDYWCDICSIPMYEIKPCDCCQGDIRLRFQDKPLPDYLPNTRQQSPENEKPRSAAGEGTVKP